MIGAIAGLVLGVYLATPDLDGILLVFALMIVGATLDAIFGWTIE